ncbi:MAG: peptide-methionine (S)-S-oxide reductase MsrA [Vicinamibacterales bacterium]
MRQRLILVAAIVFGLGYAWLGGGFAGWWPDGTPTTPAPRVERQPASGPAVEPGTAMEGVAESTGSTDQLGGPQSGAGQAADAGNPRTATAIFAAGCFWCVEADFDKVPGVLATISGFTGGDVPSPTYADVSRGGTGHTEAVEVTYDPDVVSYEDLLGYFWHHVDPFVAHRQFCDVGNQYRPGIFYRDEAQRTAAEASKARLQEQFDDPVVVEVSPAGPFYPAEAYHQDYYQKNGLQYRYYRWGCGRDARLAEIWGEHPSE